MSTTAIGVDSNTTSSGKTLFALKWTLICIYAFFGAVSPFFFKDTQGFMELAGLLSLGVLAWVHGSQRYRIKDMIVWFVITWVVSNFFEALSIKTGFPFGHYHYQQLPGPRIFEVPVTVMPLYFSMAYLAWTISQVITGQYGGRLQGMQKFILPIIAAVVMTMYDVTIDPINSTVKSLWVWHDGGAYFGVPLLNFFGWFITVHTFMQLFAFYIAGRSASGGKSRPIVNQKIYWIEAIILQFVMGFRVVVWAFRATDHVEIYRSMGLVSVFTVMFIAFISFILMMRTGDLPHKLSSQLRSPGGDK